MFINKVIILILECMKNMKNKKIKSTLSLFVVIMLVTISLTSLSVAEDENLSMEELILIVEGQLGEEMELIYTVDMENGYDMLFMPASGEERFIEAIVTGLDVEMVELYLEDVEIETFPEEILWQSGGVIASGNGFSVTEEYLDEHSNIYEMNTLQSIYLEGGSNQSTSGIQVLDNSLLLDGSVAQQFDTFQQTVSSVVAGVEGKTGTLNLVTGIFRLYIRLCWVAGVNIFQVLLFKLTAKGYFFAIAPDSIFYIFDVSKTWHDSFWYYRTFFEHDKVISPGGSAGTVVAEAGFHARYHVWSHECWAWVTCYPDGSWDFDRGMEETTP